MPDLIANARMYSVAPAAADAWKRLFAWLAQTSGIPLTVVDHAFPAKLDDLWRRPDLACTFMCGWPLLRLKLGHQVIAAPIPRAPYSAGQPVYCTHFIVRADSAFETLEDSFGRRFAFTIADSHSGYNAPRHHLLRFRTGKAPLFGEIIGPLTTPRRVLEAIIEGKADVGPQDSFAFDLMSRHLPELTSRVRIIASTETMPIPAFVAASGTPPAVVARLSETLITIDNDRGQANMLEDLCISGFAHLDPTSYELSERWAREAEAGDLEQIA